MKIDAINRLANFYSKQEFIHIMCHIERVLAVTLLRALAAAS